MSAGTGSPPGLLAAAWLLSLSVISSRGARACFRCASYHVHGFPKRDPMQKSSSSMGYGNKTVRKALPKMLRINTVTTTASHTGA
jgi:hypothetical protein